MAIGSEFIYNFVAENRAEKHYTLEKRGHWHLFVTVFVFVISLGSRFSE